jgi:hypothetical protein
MLLTGAGLLWKSFPRGDAGGRGLRTPALLTVRLSLPRKDYGELAKVSQFYRQLESRVAALPGRDVRGPAVKPRAPQRPLASAE